MQRTASTFTGETFRHTPAKLASDVLDKQGAKPFHEFICPSQKFAVSLYQACLPSCPEHRRPESFGIDTRLLRPRVERTEASDQGFDRDFQFLQG